MAVLTWTAATDNVGVTGYKVYRNGVEIADLNALTYDDSAAPEGKNTYYVKAYDAAGNLSTQSNSKVCVASAPPAYTYLLDDYPGAAAGYSLRKLRTGQVNAVEVRRDNDNATTNVLLYDDPDESIDLLSTVEAGGTFGDWVGSNSAFVTAWFDQSGNNTNAVQITESLQPYLVLTGNLREINGKAAVYFALSPRYMQTLVIATVPQPITRIAVNDFASTNLGYIIDGASLRGTLGQNAGNVRINAGTNQEYTVSPYVINTQYLTYGIFDGASSQIYKDGVGLGVKNAGTNGYDGVTLGSTPTFGADIQGSIQEAIVWGADMESDRVAIETEINNNYNIYIVTAEVDAQLIQADNDGLSNTVLEINGVRSSASDTAVANLISRNVTVITS